MQKQFDILGDFLKVAASCQKPDQKTLEGLLSPFPQSMEAISRAKEANRRDRDWYSHLTVVAEGAPVIGWVVNVRLSADPPLSYGLTMLQPKPVQAVNDIKDSVVYYGNKLKKEYKEKYVWHTPQLLPMLIAILQRSEASEMGGFICGNSRCTSSLCHGISHHWTCLES